MRDAITTGQACGRCAVSYIPKDAAHCTRCHGLFAADAFWRHQTKGGRCMNRLSAYRNPKGDKVFEYREGIWHLIEPTKARSSKRPTEHQLVTGRGESPVADVLG